MSDFQMRRFVLWAGLMLAALAANGLAQERAEKPKTVRLTIDYGDGVQKVFTKLECKEETTVFDILQQAARHPRGIRVSHKGSGDATFITAIDDVKNEGRGRNWTYDVNEKPGEASAGVVKVKPGDSILWRFGDYG